MIMIIKIITIMTIITTIIIIIVNLFTFGYLLLLLSLVFNYKLNTKLKLEYHILKLEFSPHHVLITFLKEAVLWFLFIVSGMDF